MSQLDVDVLLQQMIDSVVGVIGDDWDTISDDAEHQFQVLAQTAVRIEARKLAGTISEEKARWLMDLHRNAMETVILSIEGKSRVTLEKAINAALGVVRDAVNMATGFSVLVP